MLNEELKFIKDTEFKINSLKNDLKILKTFNDKESKKDVKDKQKIIKKLESELKSFVDKIREREATELEAAQKEQLKRTQASLDLMFEYFKHIGSLKDPQDVDTKLREQFINIKHNGPIRMALRTLLRI